MADICSSGGVSQTRLQLDQAGRAGVCGMELCIWTLVDDLYESLSLGGPFSDHFLWHCSYGLSGVSDTHAKVPPATRRLSGRAPTPSRTSPILGASEWSQNRRVGPSTPKSDHLISCQKLVPPTQHETSPSC